MASVTSKLGYTQCGGALHLVGTKIKVSKVLHTSSSQTSSMKCGREMNDFGLGRRNTSPHIVGSIICSMSSSNSQTRDNRNYHEVKLIDANCLRSVGEDVFIKYNNGREMKVKYINQSCLSDFEIDTNFGDHSTTPCMIYQSIGAPARILAIPATEEIVDNYKDRAKLNQFLHQGVVEESEHVKFTGAWLKGGENGEYEVTFKFYLRKVEMECKFKMSILRALTIALEYNIPVYVHRDILSEKGLRFLTTIFQMDAREASFIMLLVNMRREIALAEGRFSDVAFWESAGLACYIDTILMGPSMNCDGTSITTT
jgi:hypothetical protein